ncbi:MAG: LysM peptidoglycan-binding domain-containing protein [Prevotellaceae bacterium]|jgi:LysM repeat protein|nr:LysM peptidoglycan-binding domain-containing protein [Prevotellaceae bacterium]
MLLLAALCVIAHAQVPVQKSTEKARINGKVYYIHVVQKGQTLYSLSKAYGVTIEQLMENNPELSDGLKEGQNIKVPVLDSSRSTPLASPATASKEPTKEPVATKQAKPAYHLVKSGETLQDIASKYGVPTAALQQLNTDAFFKGKLQPGTLLQIPSAADEKATDTGESSVVQPPASAATADTTAACYGMETPVYLDLKAAPVEPSPQLLPAAIKAALILPLLRDMDDTLTVKSKTPENFFSFYEGALLAIENLKQEGLSLELSVYDSFYEKDVEALLQQGTLQQQDIIIGPVYAGNFKPVAQLAKERHIKIVSPLDPNTEELTIGNPYVLQISPPVYCRQKKLIEHVVAQKQANIILIYHEDGREATLLREYKHLLGERMDSVKMLAHQVVQGVAVRDTLEKLLVEGRMNCVLIASNDDALVSDIAANLYLFTFRNRYSITLYGTDRWRNFETVDIKYLHTLNLHLVVPFFIDYSAEQVQKFVEEFYEKYKTDPSQYAFQGYDTFNYFLRAMMRYGENFEDYLSVYNPQLLQTKYRFKHNGNSANGLVNVESCLIRYTPDYNIEKL